MWTCAKSPRVKLSAVKGPAVESGGMDPDGFHVKICVASAELLPIVAAASTVAKVASFVRRVIAFNFVRIMALRKNSASLARDDARSIPNNADQFFQCLSAMFV